MTKNKKMKVVIVGGGAGGLELAARLSRKNRRQQNFHLTLIDSKLNHVWKPLLHEAASGTLLSNDDEIDYLTYASGRFHWEYGRMIGLDRRHKKIILDRVLDANRHELLPQREVTYDYLVLSIGSISNDFNIPGVSKHCVFLDSLTQAENLHRELLQHFIKLTSQHEGQKEHKIVIIGGGATGVELAAELRYAVNELNLISNKAKHKKQFKLTVLESAPRILPLLPERISKAATPYLRRLGIEVLANKKVVKITQNKIHTESGQVIDANLIIWAAGVKVDKITQDFDGLELNRLNQFIVDQYLRCSVDDHIFAFGDCAYNVQENQQVVPPRAQAAHQQAAVLAKSIVNLQQGKAPLPFVYKDYGSLITISKYETLGNLMSRVAKSLYIEGMIAKWAYWSLYKKHQLVLFGVYRTCVMTLGNFITKQLRPKLKLH